MTDIEFTPEQQAKVDEIVKARISREKERWEKDSGVDDLRQELAAKDEEIAQIRREHYRADARRALVDELAAHGVTEGRVERVLRYTDLDAIERAEDGSPYFGSVRRQLASVSKDMPELLKYELGTGSGIGSKEPVLTQEKPLTREEVENMGPDEVNSRWDSVRKFMAGQR